MVGTDISVVELRAAYARRITAAGLERRGIERALHDGVQQDLIAIAVRLQLARRLTTSDLPAALTLLDEMGSDVRDALDRVRTLADGIYPSLLEARGLPDALRSAASAAGVRAHIDADGVGRHPPEFEAAAFFCCRSVLEDLVAQGGTHATIRIRTDPQALRLELAADGVEPGLIRARDHVNVLGGEVAIVPRPGREACVLVTLPL